MKRAISSVFIAKEMRIIGCFSAQSSPPVIVILGLITS